MNSLHLQNISNNIFHKHIRYMHILVAITYQLSLILAKIMLFSKMDSIHGLFLSSCQWRLDLPDDTLTWTDASFHSANVVVAINSSHMTASFTLWSSFSSPSNSVSGHMLTMWLMVCRWPQSQEDD